MSLNNITGNQYGLIIPNKKPTREPIKIAPEQNVFGEESEDEEDAKFKQPTFDVKMETLKANLRKSTKVNIEKALEQDASVFQYDEVYDEITREKDQKILEKSMPAARKPKYVNRLLEVSAIRKLEKELLNERKAQRELEAEKEKYAGKESFLTGAYKAKMAELRELVEKRRLEEAREDVMDVTKQDGLGGFYRYMYQQKTESKPTSKSQKDSSERGEKSEWPSSSRHHSSSPPPSTSEHRRDRPSSSFQVRNPSSPPRHREHRTESRRRSEHSSRHRLDNDKYASSRHSHHRRHSSSPEKHGSRHRRHRHDFDYRKSREGRRREEKTSAEKEVVEKVKQSPPPPGFIRAKPRQITDAEIEEARKRYLARKSAGLNRPAVVNSDDEC